MTEAKLTWSIWQALLNAFAWAFTRHGLHCFAEWITAMALNVEEHTIPSPRNSFWSTLTPTEFRTRFGLWCHI